MSIDANILAHHALTHYKMKFSDLQFLRKNENIVFSVSSGNKKYVLRIHRPVDGFNTGSSNPTENLAGEIAILKRLSERAPFPVQKPILTKDGSFFCMAGENIPASLLEWLDGEPLASDPKGKHAHALGRLAAGIHIALSDFDAPRPSYGKDRIVEMKSEIESAEKLGHINAAQCAVCLDTLTEIDSVMSELDCMPRAKSLIHSDLGFGNIIVTSKGLAPIDFSLSGYGYAAQECGMLASNYTNTDHWHEICKGYHDVSGITIDPHHLDSFFSMSVLLFITSQHSRFCKDDWFPSAMDRWCNTCFKRTIEKGTCA